MRIYFVFWCLLSLSLVCTSLALRLDVVRHDQTMPSLRSELFTTDRAAYLIPVGMGSPPNSLYLVLDLSISGSALWVQCQLQPSPSFAEILPCGLEGCARFPNTHCHKGECRYKLKLPDKSYTEGNVGLETITIGDVAIQNVAVACGLKNNGFSPQSPELWASDGVCHSWVRFMGCLAVFSAIAYRVWVPILDGWNCWGCPTSVVEGAGGQFISVRESLTS
jgi:hypothetical protein